jgi:DNA-binding Lrp family transcriptional regulator
MTQTLEDKIIKVMQKEGKPLRPGEIAELAGADKDEVSKSIKKLSKDGKITSPKKCFWELEV